MFSISNLGVISLTRGDTARITVNLMDDLDESYEIRPDEVLVLTVKKTVKDTTALISKEITGSNMFHIEPKDTAELNFGSYVYDVQLTTSEGDVCTVVPPTTFEILTEVTT